MRLQIICIQGGLDSRKQSPALFQPLCEYSDARTDRTTNTHVMLDLIMACEVKQSGRMLTDRHIRPLRGRSSSSWTENYCLKEATKQKI